jgi:formiminotetrahydrofolate cyclodeaminase
MNESFLTSLARPRPIPGGGAAAAYSASIGLALLEKIVRLEMHRGGMPAAQGSVWKGLLGNVVEVAGALGRLRDEDGEAYLKWIKTRDAKENLAAIHDALREATRCPIRIVERVHESLECAAEAGKLAQKHLLSDLLVVCEILSGAGKGALHIAFANVQVMLDPADKDAYRRRLAALQSLSDEALIKAREEILPRLYPS